jgi:hypothetical protein
LLDYCVADYDPTFSLSWLAYSHEERLYLISGFATQSKEEQEELNQNKSLQNTGNA